MIRSLWRNSGVLMIFNIFSCIVAHAEPRCEIIQPQDLKVCVGDEVIDLSKAPWVILSPAHDEFLSDSVVDDQYVHGPVIDFLPNHAGVVIGVSVQQPMPGGGSADYEQPTLVGGLDVGKKVALLHGKGTGSFVCGYFIAAAVAGGEKNPEGYYLTSGGLVDLSKTQAPCVYE